MVYLCHHVRTADHSAVQYCRMTFQKVGLMLILQKEIPSIQIDVHRGCKVEMKWSVLAVFLKRNCFGRNITSVLVTNHRSTHEGLDELGLLFIYLFIYFFIYVLSFFICLTSLLCIHRTDRLGKLDYRAYKTVGPSFCVRHSKDLRYIHTSPLFHLGFTRVAEDS